MRIARWLLGLAASIFAFGGAMHALAYATRASAQIGGANVSAFFGGELRGLWLADSTTLTALAILCAFISWKPSAASKTVIMLLATVPAATASLIYTFLGSFYAAHMLMGASAMVFIAGVLVPANAAAGKEAV